MPTERQLQILEERRRKRVELEPIATNKAPLAIQGPRFPSFQFRKPVADLDAQANYFSINGVPIWLSEAVQNSSLDESHHHTIRTASSLWDCGVILAKFLEQHPSLVSGKHVIELGAGKALPSIAAAALGGRVVVTDATDATVAAQHVADINDLLIHGRGPGYIECIQPLDWIHREKDMLLLPKPPFEVVLCSDVVWVEYLVPHLVQTLAELPLTPDVIILLAHQTRSLRIDTILFNSLSNHDFIWDRIEDNELHPDFRKEGVCIWKIHRTKGIIS